MGDVLCIYEALISLIFLCARCLVTDKCVYTVCGCVFHEKELPCMGKF